MLEKKCLDCGVEFTKRSKMGYLDWEVRKYCSHKCSQKNVVKRGSKAPNWLGDNINYNSLHKFIQRNFGRPPLCQECGVVGEIKNNHWNIDWANIDHKYNRDKKYWIGLCRKCHITYDKML